MSVIQLKRGLKSNIPATAQPGEPLVTLDTKEVFIGDSNSAVTPIKVESDNIIDKDTPEGVAALDADKNIIYNIKTDSLYFSSSTQITLQQGQNGVINSLPINEFRLVKWLINVADLITGNFYSCEMLAHHNGTEAEFSEYGAIGEETVSFYVAVENSFINLHGISSKNNQVVRIITTAIRFS